jgi:hypothetical protein
MSANGLRCLHRDEQISRGIGCCRRNRDLTGCPHQLIAYEHKCIALSPSAGAGVLHAPSFVKFLSLVKGSAIGNGNIDDEFCIILALGWRAGWGGGWLWSLRWRRLGRGYYFGRYLRRRRQHANHDICRIASSIVLAVCTDANHMGAGGCLPPLDHREFLLRLGRHITAHRLPIYNQVHPYDTIRVGGN